MENKQKHVRVAVVGLGPSGIAALKNFLEEGFDAVGFERNQYVGGLWRFDEDKTKTTVLRTTKANISKQRNCYQDYPFPKDVPNYPSADDVIEYIEDYADHFKLCDHCRLGTEVTWIDRSSDKSQWTITAVKGDSKPVNELFDKVLVATGAFQKPFVPQIPGLKHFQGQVLSAQAFKDPNKFTGKRVVVVGLSNTGGDICNALVGIAAKIYISHRVGVRVISRGNDKPADHKLTRRLSSLQLRLNSLFPLTGAQLSSYFISRQMYKSHPALKDHHHFHLRHAAPLHNVPPIVNDQIISHLASGAVESVRSIAYISNHSIIHLRGHGSAPLPDIDTIIFCTGYTFDYSILAPSANPTLCPTPEWDRSRHRNAIEYPCLYQGLFPHRYSDSLAFIGPYQGPTPSNFCNADLSSQAIAQVWRGNFKLPSQGEMDKWCAKNYAEQVKKVKKWRVQKVGHDTRKLERWLNEAAGNGVNETLGWGKKGWGFWWKERKLYRAVMDGVNTPFVYRVFEGREGGRKGWEGAREEILRVDGFEGGNGA